MNENRVVKISTQQMYALEAYREGKGGVACPVCAASPDAPEHNEPCLGGYDDIEVYDYDVIQYWGQAATLGQACIDWAYGTNQGMKNIMLCHGFLHIVQQGGHHDASAMARNLPENLPTDLRTKIAHVTAMIDVEIEKISTMEMM